MDHDIDHHHSVAERSGPRFTRRGLIAVASVVAGTRLLLGSNSMVRAEDPTLLIDRPVSGPFAAAVRGPSIQINPSPPPTPTWRPGQFVTNVDVEGRRMALTFDDGPSPYNTPIVLETLARYGVKATFFLVGVNVQSFPAWARRIAEEGHELGNHSVYHSPYQAAALANQIGPNQQIIQNATGITPIVNRAPGLTRGSAILNTCAQLGLYEAHTHMSTFDWEAPRHSASTLINEFVRYHRNGAFAIYHDGGNRRPTPDALPGIISYGLSIGYTFVTATELMSSGNPQPTTQSYLTAGNLIDAPTASLGSFDVCGYDAAGELAGMLARDDLTLTSLDRSRIVGALADINAISRD